MQKTPEMSGEGHLPRADEGQGLPADAGPEGGEPGGQSKRADQGQPCRADLLPALIDQIRYWHRQRVFAMEQRKRQHLALASFLRLDLGWSPDAPAAERNRLSARALDIIKAGEREYAGKPAATDDPAYGEWRELILSTLTAREPFGTVEDNAEKAMRKLARQLPVWEWAKDIRGFSDLGLAIIVAEAGNLADYPKKGHLWKRLGVAVIGSGDGDDDVRQGGLAKTARAEDWITHGYSRNRRSRMWVIGEGLVKNGAHYREIYLDRLATEHAKTRAEGLIPATSTAQTVESWAARNLPPLEKVSKIDPKQHRSAGHMARRAQRYMEKQLLRDLWVAWRQATVAAPVKATQALPAAEDIAA